MKNLENISAKNLEKMNYKENMITFEKLNAEHKIDIIRIFNYYVENSYAAYAEKKVADAYFENIMGVTEGYPAYAVKMDEKVVGFAFLRAYNPLSTFDETAVIAYFLDKDYTSKGIGGIILNKIEEDAKAKGICNILASITSKNIYSIKFHEKNGFVKCGEFPEIGRKFGNTFGIIWMIKKLNIGSINHGK
jgi:phosphinothricin acetyltransferase